MTHDKSEATSATSNYTDLTLEREGGEGSLHVETATALDGGRGGESIFLWVLDGDAVVCTGECTGSRRRTLLVLVVCVVERIVVVVDVSCASRKG